MPTVGASHLTLMSGDPTRETHHQLPFHTASAVTLMTSEAVSPDDFRVATTRRPRLACALLGRDDLPGRCAGPEASAVTDAECIRRATPATAPDEGFYGVETGETSL
jgi:hypothetical protein